MPSPGPDRRGRARSAASGRSAAAPPSPTRTGADRRTTPRRRRRTTGPSCRRRPAPGAPRPMHRVCSSPIADSSVARRAASRANSPSASSTRATRRPAAASRAQRHGQGRSTAARGTDDGDDAGARAVRRSARPCRRHEPAHSGLGRDLDQDLVGLDHAEFVARLLLDHLQPFRRSRTSAASFSLRARLASLSARWA